MRSQEFSMTELVRLRVRLSCATRGFLLILVAIFVCLPGRGAMAQEWEALRERMVNEQLRPRGIRCARVLSAMREVPRHLFVPAQVRTRAYEDSALPIGLQQTISQPYVVAFMTEQIEAREGMKVLEIGTGSGYQAAILAHLGCEVYTIELFPELAERAQTVLKALQYDRVTVKAGDGFLGWPERAPFDAIVVTAAPEEIPPPLIEQLKDGGVMILPVGPVHSVQSLKRVTKEGGIISIRTLIPVRFVPMVRNENP